MSKKILIFSFVVLCIFSLTACGEKTLMEKGIEKQIEKNLGGNVDLDLKNEGMKIETENGVTLETGENVSLPTDFPKDVFVPEGKIISAMKNVMGEGYQLVIKSDQKSEDIKKSVEEKLTAEGWNMNQSADLNGIIMLGGKKDSRTVSVTISADSEDQNKMVVIVNVFEMK
ncbi:MAG: hypothetical protein WCT18_04360 [Patescibacteria group bacterium]